MKLSMHALALGAWFLILSGCTYKRLPALQTYMLHMPNTIQVSRSKYREKVVKVAYPYTFGSTLSDKIMYTYDTSKRSSYKHSRWAYDVTDMLYALWLEALQKARLFKSVVPYSSFVHENLRLESTVYDIVHRIDHGDSQAILSVGFLLIDSDSGKLIKAKRFEYTIKTETVDAKGFVKALDRAVTLLVRDLIVWIGQS